MPRRFRLHRQNAALHVRFGERSPRLQLPRLHLRLSRDGSATDPRRIRDRSATDPRPIRDGPATDPRLTRDRSASARYEWHTAYTDVMNPVTCPSVILYQVVLPLTD